MVPKPTGYFSDNLTSSSTGVHLARFGQQRNAGILQATDIKGIEVIAQHEPAPPNYRSASWTTAQ